MRRDFNHKGTENPFYHETHERHEKTNTFHHEEHEGWCDDLLILRHGQRYYFKIQFLHTTIRNVLFFLERFSCGNFHKFLTHNI